MACNTDTTTFPGYCTMFFQYSTVNHPIYPLEKMKIFKTKHSQVVSLLSSWHSKVKVRLQGQ